VRALCDRVLWLEQGAVREVGAPNDLLDRYERFTTRPAE
jgi:ABC-type polysaccharide/polyol phosphate transport system ATPase subunit